MKASSLARLLLTGILLWFSVAAQAAIVAYYPFDGDVKDWSSLSWANDGAVTGNITYAAGKYGDMAVFDGSSHITVPNNPQLALGTTSFSISMWLKVNDTAAHQAILEKIVTSSGGFSIPNMGGSVAGHLLIFDAAPSWQYGGYGVGYAANTLGNVILIRDDAKWPGSIYLYHNGVQCCAGTWAGGAGLVGNATSTADLLIGYSTLAGSPLGALSHLTGAIDDLAIFNHALSDAEILAIQTNPASIKVPVELSEFSIE